MSITEFLAHNAVENLLQNELKNMKMHVRKLIRNEKCFKLLSVDYQMKYSKLNQKLLQNLLKNLKSQQSKMIMKQRKQNKIYQNGKSNLNLCSKWWRIIEKLKRFWKKEEMFHRFLWSPLKKMMIMFSANIVHENSLL